MKYVLLTILLIGLASCTTHAPEDDGVYPTIYTDTEPIVSNSIVFTDPNEGDITPRVKTFVDQPIDDNRVYTESDGNLRSDKPIDLFELSSPVVLP